MMMESGAAAVDRERSERAQGGRWRVAMRGEERRGTAGAKGAGLESVRPALPLSDCSSAAGCNQARRGEVAPAPMRRAHGGTVDDFHLDRIWDDFGADS